MVSVERILSCLDWEKGGGRVMTIARHGDNSKSGGKILHTELFTPDGLKQFLVGHWVHGGLERWFDIRSARIDCDADALLLDVVPLLDLSLCRPSEQVWRSGQTIRFTGKHCLLGCFKNYGGFYHTQGPYSPLDDFMPKEKLFPVVVTSRSIVLMVGWMNRQAFERSKRTKTMWYWSRSRKRLWLKGEESGHFQLSPNFEWHCGKQCILAHVDQRGGACHEGYETCFYRKVTEKGLEVVERQVFDPKEVYKK